MIHILLVCFLICLVWLHGIRYVLHYGMQTIGGRYLRSLVLQSNLELAVCSKIIFGVFSFSWTLFLLHWLVTSWSVNDVKKYVSIMLRQNDQNLNSLSLLVWTCSNLTLILTSPLSILTKQQLLWFYKLSYEW